MKVKEILHAYGVSNADQIDLVDQNINDDQRARLEAAVNRSQVTEVLNELRAVAIKAKKPYVHP